MITHSYKHEAGRQSYSKGNFREAERLARESYEETGDIHSYINMLSAQFAQGKISRLELAAAVDWAEGEHGPCVHFDSVRRRGY